MFFTLVPGIVLGLAFAYITYTFVSDFVHQPGSTWTRLLAAGKDSATILWARFCLILTTGTGALAELASYLGAPGVGDAIKSAFSSQYAPVITLGIAILIPVVSEWARRRTL